MNWEAWLPMPVMSSSLITGICIFSLGEERHDTRTVLNLSGALAKLIMQREYGM